jgi:serine/threonine protein phosphatase PrpC
MGNELSVPVTDKHGYGGKWMGCEFGVSGMQGYRKDMEDRHIHTIMPSAPDHLFLGVFDGHGGVGCADYVSGTNPHRNPGEDKCLIEILEETPEWVQYRRSGKSDGTGRNIKLLERALQSAFVSMDNQMRKYLRMNPSKAETFGGCTGVTVMITPEYIVCANAGDSRAVYSKVGEISAIPLSRDHKPTNPGETARIAEAGGNVVNKRVNGNLAISRGFGDFEFKDNKMKGPEGQMVSCIPEFHVYPRSAKDEMIILACDGLWDVCTNDQAIGFVREIWGKDGDANMQSVAEKMCDKALELESMDNISVIVVKLSNSMNCEKAVGAISEKSRVKPPSAQDLVSGKISSRPGSVQAFLQRKKDETAIETKDEKTHFKPGPDVVVINEASPDVTRRVKPPSAEDLLSGKISPRPGPDAVFIDKAPPNGAERVKPPRAKNLVTADIEARRNPSVPL